MKLNRYIVAGIIFIVLSIFIFFSNFLDGFIRPFTQLFLMGSSKGKDILFFGMLGLFLILSQIIHYLKNFKKNSTTRKINSYFIINKLSNIFKLKRKTYLKISIIIFLATAIFGLILEVIMRHQLGIAPFTIFVAMIPDPTTTSILHSHMYKSVIGNIISSSLSNVPVGIHTGDSLSIYAPEIANIIMIILPILFLSLLASLKDQLAPTRLILIFAATCGLIGLIDGGLFSTPAIIGIYGMLFIYFDYYHMNYYLGKLFKNQDIVDKVKDRVTYLKQFKIKSYSTFKRMIPQIFLLLIIILRISIAIIGTNPEYYEIDIMDPMESLYLNNSYSTLSIEEYKNESIMIISPDYNEMDLLNNLTKSLDKKCSSYSLTWNFYSYFKSYN